MLREGYYDGHRVWIPPVEVIRGCPTCDRRKYLFQKSVAERFIRNGLPPDSRGNSLAANELRRRLSESKSVYRTLPRMKFRVKGRFGIVSAGSGDGVFPLRFRMIPVGDKFVWYLHDESRFGAFDIEREFPTPPSRSEVTEVYAGDVLRVSGGRIVRLAGITVPGSNGKVTKGWQPLPDDELRAYVRKTLMGKAIDIEPGKTAKFTCRGIPVVFVKWGDVDFAEHLLRKGFVRRHPKHKGKYSSTYLKAEKEARKAKAGIWAKLLADKNR